MLLFKVGHVLDKPLVRYGSFLLLPHQGSKATSFSLQFNSVPVEKQLQTNN